MLDDSAIREFDLLYGLFCHLAEKTRIGAGPRLPRGNVTPYGREGGLLTGTRTDPCLAVFGEEGDAVVRGDFSQVVAGEVELAKVGSAAGVGNGEVGVDGVDLFWFLVVVVVMLLLMMVLL